MKTTEIPSVIINHMPIERVTCLIFLGVIIDSNLTWSHHINYISNTLDMWSFVNIKTLCTCINSENNLQFTITISPKLWNNSMGFQCWPTHKNIAKKAIRFISNVKYNSHTTQMFKNLQLLQAVDIFKLACFKFFYKCENRIIADYFKNMFLTHEHTKRLQRIRWAPQHLNKMETNLPKNNNYEIRVKHTNSKYCRFCIRYEIPKLIKDNYLPGKVLQKINTHSYSGRPCALCTKLYN